MEALGFHDCRGTVSLSSVYAMNKQELGHFRTKLDELNDRLKGDVARVEADALRRAGGEASGGISNTPLHPADLGSDHYEQEVALSLLENEAQLLRQVAEALDRIDNGTYGTCKVCGKAIARERLELLPYATHCVPCAERLQQPPPGA
jgi:RNA polymerase-binding protein DksA